MPPFLWLRYLALQRLQLIHRRQLGTRSATPGGKSSIHGGAFPAATSAALRGTALGHGTRESEAAIRAEEKQQFEEAPDRMDSMRENSGHPGLFQRRSGTFGCQVGEPARHRRGPKLISHSCVNK